MAGTTPVQADAHHDAPLTQVAVKAFQDAQGFVAPQVLTVVPVGKESDQYYTIDKDSWLGMANALRSRKTAPRRIEWNISSDAYLVKNYALAGENALEDLANADTAIALREGTTSFVTEALMRDLEDRVARLITSISNLGSGVQLTGVNKWGDTNSNPIADVTTGHAFIRQRTGLLANLALLDRDTFNVVRVHPLILDMFKYSRGGMVTEEELKNVFQVERLIIADGIKNQAAQAATASIVNIWGNICLLAHIEPGVSLKTRTPFLGFRWAPAELPAPFQVLRYNDPDPGRKVEVIEVGYYQDEKVIARDLAYEIQNTL